MNDLTLFISSVVIYLSTIGFFWGVYTENCSSANNSVVGKTVSADSVERSTFPVSPAFRDFLQVYWKPLAIFGIIFFGIFIFFMEHVCDYQ
jgi:hypothetical protein